MCKRIVTFTWTNYIATTKGAKMPRGDRKAISNFPIPLPPLPLQQLFAHRIEQIENQKAEVQKAIIDLETLLASRVQYWFE
ncbi:restriction endonuclease subunit S [Prevotellamassilia timonensis]|uniref:restriction endonuclease subunit S n=1 Tax=Prevotellamassilia timonensis TaxID=1852370 RepID=UPI0040252A12